MLHDAAAATVINCPGKAEAPTRPPTVASKMEAQSEYGQHIADMFFARLAMLSRCLLTKFLHRSSVQEVY